MSILEFLGLKPRSDKAQTQPDDATTQSVRQIVSALDQLEPERARYIACFAFLLSRVAQADLDISQEESQEMERIVEKEGRLPSEQAIIVVQMAKTRARLFGGTDNYLVAREFNQIATKEQKMDLLRCLFSVSAADQEISAVEDNEIKQIADELRIDRDEVSFLRSQFRQFLASLK